jgi:hypothetical protein
MHNNWSKNQLTSFLVKKNIALRNFISLMLKIIGKIDLDVKLITTTVLQICSNK